MANNHCSIMTFLLILTVLLISAGLALSSREFPDAVAKNLDEKQPESFINHDRSVLIPGLGRYIFPKPGSHFNPITYNPITGTNGGNGFTLPGFGGSGGSTTGRSYVPGGDDTYVPNPGFEVPIGGRVPAPNRH